MKSCHISPPLHLLKRGQPSKYKMREVARFMKLCQLEDNQKYLGEGRIDLASMEPCILTGRADYPIQIARKQEYFTYYKKVMTKTLLGLNINEVLHTLQEYTKSLQKEYLTQLLR